MAVTLFVVRATITKDRESAFNKWYNEEHVLQALGSNGAVSARRYRKILGDDKFQYMAVYEFANEAAFKKFQESDHLKTLIKDYDANFAHHVRASALGLRAGLALIGSQSSAAASSGFAAHAAARRPTAAAMPASLSRSM